MGARVQTIAVAGAKGYVGAQIAAAVSEDGRYRLLPVCRGDDAAALFAEADAVIHSANPARRVVAEQAPQRDCAETVEKTAAFLEAARWTQPILHHRGNGLNGFVPQRRHGVMHFLVRACMSPGNCELFELAATVARSDAEEYFGKPGAPVFLDLFQHPPRKRVHYDAVHSEEGGRFHHYQNRYVILEIPREHSLDISGAAPLEGEPV
jgi:hypothetical protein